MKKVICAYQDVDFKKYVKPWAEDFIVKTSDSLAAALTSQYALRFGFLNPIDFLGESDFSMRCPAVKLASRFISQDKELVASKMSKAYVAVTFYIEGHLEVGFFLKEYRESHIVCSVKRLEIGRVTLP